MGSQLRWRKAPFVSLLQRQWPETGDIAHGSKLVRAHKAPASIPSATHTSKHRTTRMRGNEVGWTPWRRQCRRRPASGSAASASAYMNLREKHLDLRHLPWWVVGNPCCRHWDWGPPRGRCTCASFPEPVPQTHSSSTEPIVKTGVCWGTCNTWWDDTSLRMTQNSEETPSQGFVEGGGGREALAGSGRITEHLPWHSQFLWEFN